MQSIQPEVRCLRFWVSRLQNILEPMLVMRFMTGVTLEATCGPAVDTVCSCPTMTCVSVFGGHA